MTSCVILNDKKHGKNINLRQNLVLLALKILYEMGSITWFEKFSRVSYSSIGSWILFFLWKCLLSSKNIRIFTFLEHMSGWHTILQSACKLTSLINSASCGRVLIFAHHAQAIPTTFFLHSCSCFSLLKVWCMVFGCVINFFPSLFLRFTG